jgi:hypothetical protein
MMKLEYTEGCVCGSLTVDDEEEYSMTDERRTEVLEAVKRKLGPRDLNHLLVYLATEYGDYESDGIPCECCGDIVCTWTLDLE